LCIHHSAENPYLFGTLDDYHNLSLRILYMALFIARPFYGARRIASTLSEDGFPICSELA
jgi:hypothetical protein